MNPIEKHETCITLLETIKQYQIWHNEKLDHIEHGYLFFSKKQLEHQLDIYERVMTRLTKRYTRLLNQLNHENSNRINNIA
jgi:hypothetical protein